MRFVAEISWYTAIYIYMTTLVLAYYLQSTIKVVFEENHQSCWIIQINVNLINSAGQ